MLGREQQAHLRADALDEAVHGAAAAAAAAAGVHDLGRHDAARSLPWRRCK